MEDAGTPADFAEGFASPTPRERQEAWELEFLAEWAARSARSRGRKRPEEPDPVRTAFQRDRDRIIHSKAFRRLKAKTQVFLDPEEDHFRTRLTHTLEVAQIARTIARALRLNEDLTEAIALAHDLGHPPFGHAGEEALDAVYREYVPNRGFRHYEQSLRVVEVLEAHNGRPGLNLTWEVRDGIARHSKGRRNLDDEALTLPSTLEGRVVRIADRIAYVNHDLDDAIRAGILAAADVPADCVQLLGRTQSQRIATMVLDVIRQSAGKPYVGMSGEVLAATDRLKEFLFERVYHAPARGMGELVKARRIVRDLFRYYMDHPNEMQGDGSLCHADIERRAQAVCDFIAGMTDHYALGRFVQHFLPKGMTSAEGDREG
ncbi:MAG: deoxyguanosinetriphosphate triphosphohydrolase [Chthonomonadales bacterium]